MFFRPLPCCWCSCISRGRKSRFANYHLHFRQLPSISRHISISSVPVMYCAFRGLYLLYLETAYEHRKKLASCPLFTGNAIDSGVVIMSREGVHGWGRIILRHMRLGVLNPWFAWSFCVRIRCWSGSACRKEYPTK